MAEKIGRITDVKLATFFPGSPTAVDTCMVTLREANTATTIFLLWVSRPNTSTYNRILDGGLSLIEHCALETYSVLTRLPAPHRTSGIVVREWRGRAPSPDR